VTGNSFSSGPDGTLRSGEQITGFFDHLELVEPGIVSCSRWRPEPADPGLGREC
jgi:hypothetical protein